MAPPKYNRVESVLTQSELYIVQLIDTSERFNKFVTKEVTQAHKIALSKYWIMCLALCQFDENTQVSGVLVIADFTNFPLKFMSTMNLSESKDMMRFQVSGFSVILINDTYGELQKKNLRNQCTNKVFILKCYIKNIY